MCLNLLLSHLNLHQIKDSIWRNCAACVQNFIRRRPKSMTRKIILHIEIILQLSLTLRIYLINLPKLHRLLLHLVTTHAASAWVLSHKILQTKRCLPNRVVHLLRINEKDSNGSWMFVSYFYLENGEY